jgi:hypothetical protein
VHLRIDNGVVAHRGISPFARVASRG